MADSKKIGLFFGSFNPVHNGHLAIANYMAEFTDLTQVWFVITPQNPFKAKRSLLPDYQRSDLLSRALQDYQHFDICTVEFKMPKPSYTIDTLTYLHELYPNYLFVMIMGSDQLNDFHRWKNSEELLNNYSILVYPRPGIPEHKLLTHTAIEMVEAPIMEISSSFIRRAIKDGKDVRFFVPERTWEYIKEMHFYE